MAGDEKTREQLVVELTELRSQNAALKKSMIGSISYELAAEESRRYAESIVETVREPLLVLDENLKIISANRNFYTTFKVIPGETLGCFIYDLGNKQWDIPELRDLLEEVLPEKQAFDDFEVTHDFQDIGHKIMLLNACRIYRKDIGAKMILLAIEDITERRRLEDLLTESEERYRRLFETANDGIVLLEKREGKITHANPATENMLGYNQKESIGKKLEDIGILLDRGDFQTTMQNLNKLGIINYDDIPIETKSGQHIDTDIYLVDRARLVQCNIRDITERKRTVYELCESEKQYRMLFNAIDEGFCIIEVIFDENEKPIDYLFLEVNPAFEKQTGLIDARGKRIRELAPKHEERWFDIYGQVAVTGRPVRFVDRAEQLHRWYDVYAFRLGQPENRQVAILFNDITARKRSEAALRESELRYHLLFEEAQDGIALAHAETGEIVDCNQALCRMVEKDKTELLGQPQRILHPQHQLKNGHSSSFQFHKTVDTEEALDDCLLSTSGKMIPVEIKASRFLMNGGAYLLGIFRDITERKKTEESLKETLESLRKAVGTTIQVMVSAVETRDPYTAGHQLRTSALASTIATEMGLTQEKIEGIRIAGSIHDIGKLSIPAEILSKPSKPSEIEFLLIKEHARHGYEILKDVESSWPLAEIVYQHHERMDGSGYPRKLQGEDICMEARILAVADVVEAMASHRPYRPALGIEAAMKEIEKNRGMLYDAGAADACLRLFRENGFNLERV